MLPVRWVFWLKLSWVIEFGEFFPPWVFSILVKKSLPYLQPCLRFLYSFIMTSLSKCLTETLQICWSRGQKRSYGHNSLVCKLSRAINIKWFMILFKIMDSTIKEVRVLGSVKIKSKKWVVCCFLFVAFHERLTTRKIQYITNWKSFVAAAAAKSCRMKE